MTEQKNKQCPFCGEYIPVDSKTCEYCNETLVKYPETTKNYQEKEPEEICQPEYEEKTPQTKYRFHYILFVIIAAIVGAGAVFGGFFIINRSIDIGFATTKQEKVKPHFLTKANKDHLNKAKQLYKNGKTDDAAQLFQNEIDTADDPTAYYYMGEIYNEQGFSKIAISNYDKALEKKKNFYEPLKRLAEVYLSKYENDKALEYAAKAIKIHPKDVDLLKTLALIYQNLDDSYKLLETYKKITTLDKKDYPSNYYLANYYYQNERYREAIPYFKNLINTEYNTDIAYMLAISYSRIEYYTKAIETLDLIIKKDPYEHYRASYIKDYLSTTNFQTNNILAQEAAQKPQLAKPQPPTARPPMTVKLTQHPTNTPFKVPVPSGGTKTGQYSTGLISSSGSSGSRGAENYAPNPTFVPVGSGSGNKILSGSGSGSGKSGVGTGSGGSGYGRGTGAVGRKPGGGGGRPGIDAIREPDFGPYMRELQRKIKMNWEPPKGNESKRVVLLFKIAKDGKLLSVSVYKSSGLQNVDQAAINAVKVAAPFRALPPEYKGANIDIQFTFDYNVYGTKVR